MSLRPHQTLKHMQISQSVCRLIISSRQDFSQTTLEGGIVTWHRSIHFALSLEARFWCDFVRHLSWNHFKQQKYRSTSFSGTSMGSSPTPRHVFSKSPHQNHLKIATTRCSKRDHQTAAKLAKPSTSAWHFDKVYLSSNLQQLFFLPTVLPIFCAKQHVSSTST